MNERSGTGSAKVLIVDDEAVVVDVLKLVLERHHLVCEGALTATEAIARLEQEQFWCALVDKNLPDQSGLEVLRAAQAKQSHCACLLMTGYPTAESVVEAMRLGAVDYLEKPFTALGLVAQRVLSAVEHARIAYERAELAQALEQMRLELRRSEDLAHERQTAVQVFDRVLARRLELATTRVTHRVAQLEALLAAGRQQALELSSELAGPAQQKARGLAELLTAC